MPAWKRRNITDIRRADVLRLLDAISDRGAPAMANKTLSVAKRLFNWCLERGLIEISPVAPVKAPNKERSRDRVLTDAELADIWTATEGLGYPMGPFYRFLILTAQRRGEVAEPEWQDVNLERALWTLPPEKTKPGRVHDVPLSGAALELLEGLPRFEKGNYVFTTTGGERPISGFSKAKAAFDAKILEQRCKDARETRQHPNKVKGMADWTIHDLRRTAATWMAGAGVPPHVLSALLNHSPGTAQGVTSIYNRFRYVEERREALEKWAEHVLALVEKPTEKSQVVPIR
ncbi:tyrosine-type recombinase/integrase [Acidobacteria bacterium AH-259-O06]|nr:tyrosine-type recombinase/integrase [Acidobacteria bacterium AH-259-O06]